MNRTSLPHPLIGCDNRGSNEVLPTLIGHSQAYHSSQHLEGTVRRPVRNWAMLDSVRSQGTASFSAFQRFNTPGCRV